MKIASAYVLLVAMTWAQKQTGFTIVELLIVVVVIAILAAITIVSYNGITNRANDSAIQQDLTTIAKKIQISYTQNGVYPTGAGLRTAGVTVSKGSYSRGMFNGASWYNMLYCWPDTTNPNRFALIAQSKSGNVYQWVDGSLTKIGTTLQGSIQQCASAGVTINGVTRDWFYDQDAWQASIVGS